MGDWFMYIVTYGVCVREREGGREINYIDGPF